MKKDWMHFILIPLIVFLAIALRIVAVERLPVDFDEFVYLPDAFRYQEMIVAGKWRQIPHYDKSMEHPPLNKLLFAAELAVAKPKEPDWEALQVGKAIPDADKPAFSGPRKISAVGGTVQVLIIAIVNPIAGLLLTLNTYHIKYSAQVYLEGIPGMMAVLSVFLFEKEIKRQSSIRWSVLILSAAALGFAAAGKYLYGIPGFVIAGFLYWKTRSIQTTLLYCFASLAFFFIADPFLWPDPAGRLWKSLTFHWGFAHSKHVVSSGLPWYSPIMHLLRAAPATWHPNVFYISFTDPIPLPLSLIGMFRAFRERPVWASWAILGLGILLIWPTKWPQYILLVLPPLCVCAAIGIQQLWSLISRVWVQKRNRG